MRFHMVADHAVRPPEDDIIFGIAAQAAKAVSQHGKDNVINASIGTLLDDEGNLIALEGVYGLLKGLSDAEIASYAALAGEPDFLAAVQEACFGDFRPDAFTCAVATPGGTGAVKHAVTNFTNPGDSILSADWYWAPYKTIADEYQRGFETFQMFTGDGKFNLAAFEEAFTRLLNDQGRLVSILNTPAHNPTGYTISLGEWESILSIARKAAADPGKRIIFLVDLAYIDFSGDGTREFLRSFGNLPANILILLAYSASKSYTMYGLRNGALIAISSDKEVVDEVFYSCAHSNRGTWSNGTRGAMAVIAKIYANPSLRAMVEEERDECRKMLAARSKAFLDSSRAAGLALAPYCGGFFVTVLCPDPVKAAGALAERNIFAVPLQSGLRFAVCALNESQCAAAPSLVRETLDALK